MTSHTQYDKIAGDSPRAVCVRPLCGRLIAQRGTDGRWVHVAPDGSTNRTCRSAAFDDPMPGDDRKDEWGLWPRKYRSAAAYPGRPGTYLTRPDWGSLYSAESPQDEKSCTGPLTPRTAAVLHAALDILGDHARDDAGELGDTPVTAVNSGGWEIFTRLPRVTYCQGREWRMKFAQAFSDLSDRLAGGKGLSPACTAEEMALHLAIGFAPAVMEMAGDEGGLEGLPECTGQRCACPSAHEYGCDSGHIVRRDFDWWSCSASLFEDHDVLILFDPKLDGFEDPDGKAASQMGFANLGVADWFTPFRAPAQA